MVFQLVSTYWAISTTPFQFAKGLLSELVVLLVDPRRQFDIIDFKFEFWTGNQSAERSRVPCFLKDSGLEENANTTTAGGTGTLRDNLVSRITRRLEQHIMNSTMLNPGELVKTAVVQLMRDDLSSVLSRMSCALDVIELALHNDVVLQESMPIWREQLGGWRNALYHQIAWLDSVAEKLAAEAATDDPLKQRLKLLERDVERMAHRIETTFQALMSSITIVESERAIKEAEAVSKLTQLAFFFIPLSLVAGIFGMNIVVCTAPPRI